MTRSAKRPPATPATRALEAAGVAWTGHTYTHDPSVTAYGLEAAAALGVDAGRVFKTLVAEADGELVIAVVPVAERLDLGALAAALGVKGVAMADRAVAERRTGYVAGGISALRQRNAHRTAIDASASDQSTVFVSGGRRGFDVELAPADLAALTGATIARICTEPRH